MPGLEDLVKLGSLRELFSYVKENKLRLAEFGEYGSYGVVNHHMGTFNAQSDYALVVDEHDNAIIMPYGSRLKFKLDEPCSVYDQLFMNYEVSELRSILENRQITRLSHLFSPSHEDIKINEDYDSGDLVMAAFEDFAVMVNREEAFGYGDTSNFIVHPYCGAVNYRVSLDSPATE